MILIWTLHLTRYKTQLYIVRKSTIYTGLINNYVEMSTCPLEKNVLKIHWLEQGKSVLPKNKIIAVCSILLACCDIYTESNCLLLLMTDSLIY